MELLGILILSALSLAELVGFFISNEEYHGAMLFARPIAAFVGALLCGGGFFTALLWGLGWGFFGFILSMLVSEFFGSYSSDEPAAYDAPTHRPPPSEPAPAPDSADKGYTTIRLKQADGSWHLCKETEGEVAFYIDYEDGTVFLDWHDGKPREVIGYYGQEPDANGLVEVFDSTRQRVIGRVGSELIFFRRQTGEDTCLACYTKSGGITTLRAPSCMGRFNGNELGGAAAFVAIFYTYPFQSIYRDYFLMDPAEFQKKHQVYFSL